jgi:RHS repeat-associated protein
MGGTEQREEAIALRDTFGQVAKDVSGKAGEFHDVTADAASQGAHALADTDTEFSGKLNDLGNDPVQPPAPKPIDPQASPGGDVGARPPGAVSDDFQGGGEGGQSVDGNSGTNKAGDPVDVVSGQMLTSTSDIELPGALSLILRRAYASGYRHGQLFGPGWSSTLDQRIVIDDDGIHFLGDDAQILDYPVPSQPGQQVLPAAGARWPLTWDRKCDLITIHDVDARQFLQFPGGRGPEVRVETRHLTRLEDRNSNWVQIQRDADGIPTDLYHQGGYHLRVDSSFQGAGVRIEGIRLLDGSAHGVEVKRFGYDAFGRLAQVTDSTGVPYVYEYDRENRITAWIDRLGHRYEYVYDAQSRVVTGSGSQGCLSASFDYDEDGRVTTVTDSLGHVSAYHYDGRGRVVKVIDPLGRATSVERGAGGHVLSKTDAVGHTTTYTRDSRGRILVTARPDGSTVTTDYGPSGDPVRITGPTGAVWSNSYDDHGNLTESVDPLGAGTRFFYDERGGLATQTDAAGAVHTFERDRAGLTISSGDSLGSRVAVERDAFGRVCTLTNALGGITRLTWSVEGRLLTRTMPDGSDEEHRYDAHGNLVEHVDSLGRTTRFEYGPFGTRTAKVYPDGRRYEFSYDTELRVTAVTGPTGSVWRYTYDAAGGLIAETDFSGRTVSYELDGVGLLARRANGAGQSVEFDRDPTGRVVARRTALGETRFDYDGAGWLMRAQSPDNAIVYTRDALGRILTEQTGTGILRNEYDQVGRRVRRTTASGAVSEWTYDVAGRPVGLSTLGGELAFGYDGLGREISRVFGTAALSRSWDEAHRLTAQALWTRAEGSQEYALATSWAFRYAPDGLIEESEDSYFGRRRYEFDDARRVTAVETADWSERYAYDAVGNLTAAASPDPLAGEEGGPREFAYVDGLLRRAGNVSYTYDSQGRRTRARRRTLSGKIRDWVYEWDADDRLTLTIDPDGVTWRYSYDPIGRRIAKQRLAQTGDVAEEVRFTWDGTALAEQHRDPGDGQKTTLTWDYEPGTHRVVTQIRRFRATAEGDEKYGEPQLLAAVTDEVGTPTQLVSLDGQPVWQARTTLWGQTRDGGDLDFPLRFPGQYHDPETGWSYNYFRHYDPESAQYTSPDPLGLQPAPNPYGYVTNALAATDPLGLAESVPLGEKKNPFPDRESAYRAAKELAGVPHDEAPFATWQVGGDEKLRGRQPGYLFHPDPAHWGNFEQYETDGERGSRVIVEHTDDPAGSHFHAGQPKDDPTRKLANFGWASKRTTDDNFERYGAIDKPGGDHHLFYNGGNVCPT